MKIKTSELIGAQLDWAVAKCEDIGKRRLMADEFPLLQREGRYLYSSDWSQGGPILDDNKISLDYALCYGETKCDWEATSVDDLMVGGPTMLIAAMRCLVSSKLGDEVEIPEELT